MLSELELDRVSQGGTGVSAFGLCPHCARFLHRVNRGAPELWQFYCAACAVYFHRHQVISWEVTWQTGELQVWEPTEFAEPVAE